MLKIRYLFNYKSVIYELIVIFTIFFKICYYFNYTTQVLYTSAVFM